jgi:hypothetical protein
MTALNKHEQIEVPAQLSVRDLKSWLVRFGEENRKHFEQNQLSTPTGSVQSMAQKFEEKSRVGVPITGSKTNSSTVSVSSSRSKTSTPPTTKFSTSNLGDSFVRVNNPVFRDFKAEEFHSDFPMSIRDEEADVTGSLDSFRIVSITKLLEQPKVPVHRRPLSWDVSDDFSDPWVCKPPRRFPSSSPFDATDHHNVFDDNFSTVTGRYTDPGLRSATLSAMVVNSQHARTMKKNNNYNDDNASSTRSTKSIRNKLPLLMCKSRKEEAVFGSFPSKSTNDSPIVTQVPTGFDFYQTDDWPKSDRYDGDDEAFTPFENRSKMMEEKNSSVPIPVTTTAKYQLPSIMSEDTTVATIDSMSPFIGDVATMADIFAEELQFEEKEKYAAPSGKNHLEQYFDASRSLGRSSAASASLAFSTATTITTSKGDSIQKAAPTSEVIRKFGGKAKSKSTVQLRREQLEKKWAEDRVPVHSRKVSWQVKGTHGSYKKKVELHYA